MHRKLSPEERLSLRILLDRLHESGERCRQALDEVSAGRMTTEDYSRMLREQMTAQRDWEERHLEYRLVREA